MSDLSLKKVAVLGAGSWGTALAILLARNGCDTRLWSHTDAQAAEIQRTRSNAKYLPDITFPENLLATAALEQALDQVDLVLFAVPSRVFRQVLQKTKGLLPGNVPVSWATKGMEPDTCKLLHEMVLEELGQYRTYAVISGPTFAREVALGLPTAVTVASTNNNFAMQLAMTLHNDTFRAYTSRDVTGVQVGGATKNVLAVAAGIADGLGLGANTRAALITRGLAEVQRLGLALGGERETFMGLAGLGDLVLTCTDNQSRNRRIGLALAKGKSLDAAIKELGQVAEGIYTAKEVFKLATTHQVDMPISEEVYHVVYNQKDPREAVHALLARAIKPEIV